MATYSIQLDVKGANLFNTGIPALYLENGTNIPVSGYGFDASTQEQIFFAFKVPFYLSGNITVNLRWYSQTGQTTGAVVWGVQIAALTAGDAQSVLTDALATAQTTTTTVNGTARGPTATTVTVTNLDSIAADDTVQMRIYRDAAAGGDTMTGDAILFDVEIEYAATGGVGTGDVNGPGSATDNAIARFDLTTGKVIQNSGVIIDDSNNVSGVGTINGKERITLTLGAAVAIAGTGLGAIAGLVSASLPAGSYRITVIGSMQRTNATASILGIGIDAGGTVVATHLRAMVTNTTATAFLFTDITADNTAAVGGSEAASGGVRAFEVHGVLQTSSSGTISFMAQRSAGAAQVNANTTMLIETL